MKNLGMCYLAGKENGACAVLRGKNLATNYSIQEVKQKWFDIRLERNIMACRKTMRCRRRLHDAE